MVKHRSFIVVFVCMLLSQSCGRAPYACFTTEPKEDSIHVNQPVTFRANCTSGADSYFWEFYDKDDSTMTGFNITRTFYDTGEVKVFLLVVGNGKTSSTERYITVQP